MATQLRYPTSATWPARALPLVRGSRSSRPPARRCYAGVRGQLALLDARPTPADHADARSTRWSPAPSRSSASSRERLAARRPERRADARGADPAATTASTTCRTCARVPTDGRPFVVADYDLRRAPDRTCRRPSARPSSDLGPAPRWRERRQRRTRRPGQHAVVDLYLRLAGRARRRRRPRSPRWPALLARAARRRGVRRVAVTVAATPEAPVSTFTFRPAPTAARRGPPRPRHAPDGRAAAEPVAAARLRRSRGCRRAEDVLLYHCVATDNPSRPAAGRPGPGARLSSCATTPGRSSSLPQAERAVAGCLDGDPPGAGRRRGDGARLDMNHVLLYVWPTIEAPVAGADRAHADGRAADRGRRHRGGRRAGPDRPARRGADRRCRAAVLLPAGLRRRRRSVSGAADRARCARSTTTPQKVLRLARARHGLPVRARAAARPATGGTFVEHDLDDTARLVPVDRPPGRQQGRHRRRASSRTPTARYPEGMTRVALLGDPTQALGTLAEPECAPGDRGARPRRGAAACRSSGSRCRPARRSRWTAAPRTWTGWPGRCAGSSSSPRAAARSTSSSPASTSAPSRTGTPRRRCSCTPGASWS